MKRIRTMILVIVSLAMILVFSSLMSYAEKAENTENAEKTEKEGDFIYTVEDGKATLLGVERGCILSGELVLPSELGGYPVVYIGDYAFMWQEITSLVISDSVKDIGYGAFLSCSNLEYVKFGANVINTGLYSFSECRKLTNVELNDRIGIIDAGTFCLCAIEHIDLPESLMTIDVSAFSHCSLKEINIPDNVRRIEYGAFENCCELEKVTVGKHIAMIDNYAFARCYSLREINLPDTYFKIGEGVFGDSAYAEDEANWCDDLLYVGNKIIFARQSSDGQYDVKSGTIYIADKAFASVTGKISLYVFSSGDEIVSLGKNVFPNNKNVTAYRNTAVFPDPCTHFKSYGTNVGDICDRFDDMEPKEWYADNMIRFYAMGYISGTAKDSLSPCGTISRAQFVQILARIAGVDLGSVEYKETFNDVSSDAWYAKAVTWAVEFGITGGMGEGIFAPDAPVTRQQLAVFLCAYAEKRGMHITNNESRLSDCADSGDIAPWAKRAVVWAVDVCIMCGDNTKHLNPAATATRAEAVTMMKKHIERMKCEASQ